MSEIVLNVRQAHRALMRNAFYPLLLSSGMALALYSARVWRSHKITFLFLVWNLILAWVPYLASLWAEGWSRLLRGRWWLLPGALWLAFFPNASYIVTDFWHLQDRPPVPVWYDIGLLAVFAWTGLFLAVHSLRIMQGLVRRYLGALVSWLFVAGAVVLSGLGVYLGRFLRWNSWDLLFRPQAVLADVAMRVLFPWQHPRTVGVTLLFGALLFICYLTLNQREVAR